MHVCDVKHTDTLICMILHVIFFIISLLSCILLFYTVTPQGIRRSHLKDGLCHKCVLRSSQFTVALFSEKIFSLGKIKVVTLFISKRTPLGWFQRPAKEMKQLLVGMRKSSPWLFPRAQCCASQHCD